jgi:hypothetical protein
MCEDDMTDLNIGSILLNWAGTGVAVGATAYLFKRWMDAREKAEAEIRINASIEIDKVEKNLSKKHEDSTIEIKREIAGNRTFYEKTYYDLKQDIRQVFDLQRVANGRTSTLEKGLAVLEQAHKDRTGKLERNTDVECC